MVAVLRIAEMFDIQEHWVIGNEIYVLFSDGEMQRLQPVDE